MKNFVELASISAGDSDEEIDRVLFFQAALSGYAPILLETNWSQNQTFDALLEASDKVVRSIRADKSLPKKLIESNRILPWIKAKKEQHGTVEESSMTTMTQINQSGVYTISSDGIKIKFDQLKGDAEDKLRKKMFNYDDLCELRSKLMLITIGADGKKLVERFTRILGLVEAVNHRLRDLVLSGCHLFVGWKAIVFCQTDHPAGIVVNFKQDGGTIIQGDSGACIEKQLDQIASFLEVCILY